MWKKLNLANRTKEVLATVSPPQTPEDEFKARPYEIEPLNFNSLAPPKDPQTRHVKHTSEVPTIAASSVYSQPTAYSPNPRATLTEPWRDEYPDVSPPSSAGRDVRDDGRVSPIDEHASRPTQQAQVSPKYGSQIPRPSLRKTSSGTRWDAYSGEPTYNSSGKVGTFTPGNPYYNPDGNENIPPANSRDADPPQERATMTERASRLGPKNLAKSIKQPVQPWSRAIGRTTFVDPVKDMPQTQRLHVPPRNPKRPSPAISPESSPVDGETPFVSHAHETQVVATSTRHYMPMQHSRRASARNHPSGPL